MSFDAEIVVIGSGPAGALTAALCAEAGRDVLVVEEGPWLPADVPTPFGTDEMRLKYRHAGATAALGQPNVAYVEGRCVGGGSEINSGLYHRTPTAILAEWRRSFRLPECTASEMEPFFTLVETSLGVATDPSGTNQASRRLKIGSESLGWKVIETPRWYRQHESGVPQRQSMTRTFIPRLISAGGRLRSNCRVDRIVRSRKGWCLEVRIHGPAGALTEQIQTRQVVLCAGAIQTPTLLRRSGLSHLAGRTLRLHATAKITARFADTVNTLLAGVPTHQVKEFAPELTLGCSISEPPHLHLAMLDVPGGQTLAAEHWPRMATYYAMTCIGNGSVTPLPGCTAPLVRFAVGRAGLAVLHDGLVKLAKCLIAAGATHLYPACTPGIEIDRDRDVVASLRLLDPRKLNLMTIHLMGTCPMGDDSTRSPCGPYGAVRGHSGLRVNDASLLPSGIGVNPQGTIMAIAARNTLELLQTKHA